QGGGMQIKRLLALREAHLVAPSEDLTARERLEADFEDAPKPVVVAQNTAAPAPGPAAASTTGTAAPTPRPAPVSPTLEPVAEAETDQKPDAVQEKKVEPNKVILANRVKAKVQLVPTPPGSDNKSGRTIKPLARTSGSKPGASDSSYEIRELKLWGAV